MRRHLWVMIPLALLLSACGASDGEALPTRVVLDTPTPEPSLVGAAAPILNFWEATNGTLPAASLTDAWRFVGQPGDIITVRALATGKTLTLTLQDPEQTILAQGGSIEATLPTGGIYTVIVRGDSAGAYEIGLGYADRPNPADQRTAVPQVVGVPTPTPPFEGRGVFSGTLEHNVTVSGELDDVVRDHVYTFDGSSGRYIQVEANRVNGQIDPSVTVFDPEGLPIAFDDNSGAQRGALLRNIRLNQDGIYSVQVNGGGLIGAYSMRMLLYDSPAPITPTTMPTPTPVPTLDLSDPTPAPAGTVPRLQRNTPVFNTFDQPTDLAIHSFEAAQGEIVTIGIVPAEDSTVQLRAEVINPDGELVASEASTESTAAEGIILSPFLAEIEGVYQVFVTPFNETTGDYLIGVGTGATWFNAVQGAITADNAAQGDIITRGQQHIWTLPLGAGDIISAAVSAESGANLDAILELVAVSEPNQVIAIDDNGGGGRNPLLSNIRITSTDNYLLRVRAASAATTGGYTLIWRYVNRAPTPTPIPAVAFVFSTDDILSDGEYRFYPFQGRAGQVIQVRAIAADGTEFDPIAALLAPDGTLLLEVDDSENDLNARFTYTLPEDGVYNIRVTGYLQGGAYTLTVEEVFQ